MVVHINVQPPFSIPPTMKHKILVIIFIAIAVFSTTRAKSLLEIWENRPTSFLNGLESKIDIKTDTITGDFMAATLTKASDIQIKRLPTEASDSIICVIHTYYGPIKESTVTLYTQEWDKIGNIQLPTAETFLEEANATGTAVNDDSLKIDTYLLCARLSPNDNNLTISIDFPTKTGEKPDSILGHCKDKTMVWNGKTFK